MQGRPLRIEWGAEDTGAALKMAYLAERDGIVRTRLHALWLLRTGRSVGAVAAIVGTHYRSVQRWLAWYRQGGLALVRARQAGGVGQVARLSRAAQTELSEAVSVYGLRCTSLSRPRYTGGSRRRCTGPLWPRCTTS